MATSGPERTPEGDTMGQTVNEDDFHWDDYLKETESLRAPSECFRQAKIPPANDFEVGMKLEAHDPRNMTSICIATVVGITGARLCLRLDGSDNRNDFWKLVDSPDIQPVGTCEKEGHLLQPPLGYQMNPSSWPMFVLRTLKGCKMAPAALFKEEPPKPPLNNFKVGMKLEAADRKNPYMIGPATVGKVKGDEIYITFDGWSKGFDYWCKYYCRDIFPVGWCHLTGDVLQPPGTHVSITKNIAKTQPSPSRATQHSMQSPQKTAVILPPQQNRKSGRTKPPAQTSLPKKGSSVKNSTPRKKGPNSGRKEKQLPVVCSTSTASMKSLIRKYRFSCVKDAVPETCKIVMSTVCVYVNKRGNCGPHLDPNKIQQLPNHFGPGPVNVVLRRIVQACVDCAIQSKTVFGFLKPDDRGGEVITAFFEGETHSIQLPPVNSASFALRFLEKLCHSMQCDNLLSSQPFSSFRPNTHSPAEHDKSKSEDVTEKKSIKRSAPEPLPYVVPLSPKLSNTEVYGVKEVLSSEGNGMPKEEKLPEGSKNSPLNPENSLNPASGDHPVSTQTTVSRNFSPSVPGTSSSALVGRKSSTKSSQHKVKFQIQRKSEATGAPVSAGSDMLQQSLSDDPESWSVEEVILFLKRKDPQISGLLADSFREHEIDGQALLLLKSEVMMKYMGLKLGPTLKICYYIEKLKEGK
ncbi:sex comb on midleg-like protein 2 [Manis pentadactyla]|uniref:sex comb on midleg-like protein 2 n=1 Tax=Manis pentadactyla TaxID=143292 RepID=UPI00255C380B|nr:sex comb on midleg-like protein 2 [Manis pentadactyla]KAI5133205.1 Sex Comb On Midleg-Like Protein 2 [Manis pentadactyla]